MSREAGVAVKAGRLLTSGAVTVRYADDRSRLFTVRGDHASYAVVQQQWSPSYDERHLVALNLHRGDVSAVNYGANPNTSVSIAA